MTFGEVITQARKDKKLSQKQVAAETLKEDGQAISAQYLNDIEHDRRKPSQRIYHSPTREYPGAGAGLSPLSGGKISLRRAEDAA